MATVIFHGDLKGFADKPIELEVGTFRELISGLLTQIKGLQAHLRRGYYKVRIGRQYLNEAQITKQHIQLDQGNTIHFTPVIAGVVLITVGF